MKNLKKINNNSVAPLAVTPLGAPDPLLKISAIGANVHRQSIIKSAALPLIGSDCYYNCLTTFWKNALPLILPCFPV